MTQAELANRAGNFSAAYVSDLERNKISNPTVDVIQTLADVLGVRPDYLLGWSDDPLGEDLPASERDGRVVYQVASPEEYQRIEQLIEIFSDIPPEAQPHALTILETFRRAQSVRIVG